MPVEKRAAEQARGIADYLRTGSSPMIGTQLQLTAVRKDGTRIPVEVTITQVELPGDPVFTGYLRDMTAQHAAQAEADRLRERLAQAERLDSLGQLAGGDRARLQQPAGGDPQLRVAGDGSSRARSGALTTCDAISRRPSARPA